MGTLLPQARGPGTFSLSQEELQDAMSEASLLLHCPPDFPKDAEIVGVCALSDELTGQSQYGWMVADFLSFKLAFYRVGHRDHQSWLSTIDVAGFIRANSQAEYPADSPLQTHILGRDNNHITRLSHTSKAVESELLDHIRIRAQAADERKSTLVLIFFAPITADQDVCLDFHGEKVYLTTTKLCDAIRDAVNHSDLPVVYMTPSPFTTGWVCRPALMGKMTCTPDQGLAIIAKSCGSAFADGFMKRFVTKQTPLLSDMERKKARYDILMPISATIEQTELLHDFQELIYQSLKQKLSSSALEYTMEFENFDAWEEYAARKGRALGFWATRFSPFGSSGGIDRFEFLGGAFGGTKASQLFHIRYLITLELDTCPGDWSRGITGVTPSLFQGIFQMVNPANAFVERVFDALEFRASSMILAQSLGKALGLPLPDHVKCRYWHDRHPQDCDRAYYTKLQAAFGEVHNLFDPIAVSPREERHDIKMVRFLRSSRWLSAAIAHKFEGIDDSKSITKFVLKEMAPRFEAIRKAQLKLVLENDSIHKLGRSWLASVGLCNDTAVLNKKIGESGLSTAGDPFISTPRADRTVRSASLLNPKAPEYRVVGPKVKLEVQTPARENIPLGWTPMPPQIPDKHLKPRERTVSPGGDSTPTPAAIKVKSAKGLESKTPSRSDMPITELHKPADHPDTPVNEAGSPIKESGTPVKESDKPVNLMKLVHPVGFVKSNQPGKTAESPLSLEPVRFNEPNIAPKPDTEDEATKVLSALMSGGASPQLLAEVFKKAFELVMERDVKAGVAASVSTKQETAAHVGGLSALPTEQHGGSLPSDKSIYIPAVPTEVEAVTSPTPPGSPKWKDGADSSVNGLYVGDDIWVKAQSINRRYA
ncbi:hypothetical protein QBC43DRAFT_366468 [Cladorrhinum sp. PSN259]|nr:hypothetical protein QBC43DRAFT_366468 [Cladorrhinum sp. PSN259]